MKDNKNKNNLSPKYEELDDFSPVARTSHKPAEENLSEAAHKVTKNINSVKYNKKAIIKICIALLSVAVIIFGAVGVYGATISKDTILDGLMAGDVLIGGETTESAAAKINGSAGSSIGELIINANGKKYVVKPDDIDMMLDVDATVDKAMSIAKGENVFSRGFTALKVKLSGNKVMPVISYNKDKFMAVINKIGEQAIGSLLCEHTVRFDEDGKAFIVPGVSGFGTDLEQLLKKVDVALAEADTNEINVSIQRQSPKNLTIEALDAMVYQNPQDAAYVLENGQVVVTPSKDGRYIDKDYCKTLLSKVREGGEEIEVPYSLSPAKVDAKVLEEKLFNGNLGSYTTRYAAGGNRGTNVAVAASKINGAIILPGETFSFNGTVGRRTVANGFKIAPEYQNGQTVDGVGGGTCQVSTTLYSALLYADMKITKRLNHSMSVSYVPLGQDATVTDGGIDLQFMNDTAYPVKISAVTGGGKITVTIIGTEPENARTVKIVHSPVAYAGGKAVSTKRYVYDANGNIIKEENMGTSKYKPHSTPSPVPSPETTESVEAMSPEEVIEPQASQVPEQISEPSSTHTPKPTEVASTKQPTPQVTKKPEPVVEKEEDKTPIKSED